MVHIPELELMSIMKVLHETYPLCNKDLYHYTSIDGFNSIVFGQEQLTLRASRADCMNDISEGQYILDVYHEVLKDFFYCGQITEEQYEILNNVQLFHPICYSVIENSKTKIDMCNSDQYLCCFTEKEDSLPMWNYYTKKAESTGYNIGLHNSFIQTELENMRCSSDDNGLTINIAPVIYDKQEQRGQIVKIIQSCLSYLKTVPFSIIHYSIVTALEHYALIFKNSCFSYEHEVRIIIKTPPIINIKFSSHHSLPVKYRTQNDIFVPYIELHFPQAALKSICIGPLTNESTRTIQQSIIQERLFANRVENVQIQHSSVPIRF